MTITLPITEKQLVRVLEPLALYFFCPSIVTIMSIFILISMPDEVRIWYVLFPTFSLILFLNFVLINDKHGWIKLSQQNNTNGSGK